MIVISIVVSFMWTISRVSDKRLRENLPMWWPDIASQDQNILEVFAPSSGNFPQIDWEIVSDRRRVAYPWLPSQYSQTYQITNLCAQTKEKLHKLFILFTYYHLVGECLFWQSNINNQKYPLRNILEKKKCPVRNSIHATLALLTVMLSGRV